MDLGFFAVSAVRLLRSFPSTLPPFICSLFVHYRVTTTKIHLSFFIPKRIRMIYFCVDTAQKLKFSIKDFFSKCDQIRRKLLIWSHLLKKSLMENFIFCANRVTTHSPCSLQSLFKSLAKLIKTIKLIRYSGHQISSLENSSVSFKGFYGLHSITKVSHM